jgi:hypothetical protein
MRNVASLAIAIGLGFCSVSAQAMPFSPEGLSGDSMISKVRYGCGPGMTRGPYGHCRPRFTCPPGWHPGPYGWHCFRD